MERKLADSPFIAITPKATTKDMGTVRATNKAILGSPNSQLLRFLKCSSFASIDNEPEKRRS